MKLLTIHRRYGKKLIDFEIHDDGEVAVAGYDIEADAAAAALGFKPSDVLLEYWKIQKEPYFYFSDRGMLGRFFKENDITPVLTVSTSHITDRDDETLKIRSYDEPYYEVSGLYYENADQGYRFFLHKGDSPREIVAENKNKDNLSESLVAALQIAYDNGIYEVLFDAEGLELEGVETHEW